MSRRIGLVLWAALVSCVSASAGYREQLEAWEAYVPPAPYRGGAPGSAPQGAGDDEFRVQAAALREAGARWSRALDGTPPEESFLARGMDELERLRTAAPDLAAVQAALADGFTLGTLEALSLLRSPEVAAKAAEARAAAESYGQVANLDEILRQYSVFTAGLMTGVGAMDSGESIAVRFPFPGVLALKGRVAALEAREARERLEAARRNAVTEARRLWWELGYLYRAEEITSDMLELLEQLKDAAASRYAAGETTFQDVVKVAIEREKVTEQRTTLDQEVRNAEAGVRTLLALPPGAGVGRPGAGGEGGAVPEVGPLYGLAVERRQELRALRAGVERTEAMIEMAETMVYPRFHLDLSSYDRDEVSAVGPGQGMARAAGAFPETTAAGVGAGLPRMPWYGTQDAYLREIRERLAALRSELAAGEAATMLEVREAWFRLDRAARELALFEDRVLVLTEAALEASTRGYAAGTVMFADVIMSYAGWFETHLALERRRADRGVAAAELEAAVGRSPVAGAR